MGRSVDTPRNRPGARGRPGAAPNVPGLEIWYHPDPDSVTDPTTARMTLRFAGWEWRQYGSHILRCDVDATEKEWGAWVDRLLAAIREARGDA